MLTRVHGPHHVSVAGASPGETMWGGHMAGAQSASL